MIVFLLVRHFVPVQLEKNVERIKSPSNRATRLENAWKRGPLVGEDKIGENLRESKSGMRRKSILRKYEMKYISGYQRQHYWDARLQRLGVSSLKSGV